MPCMATAEPVHLRTRRPPDDISHVRLFMALADEYESLAAAHPVIDQFTFGADRSPADRWARLVRAFALRKFTLQTTDNVYLTRVADALDRLLPTPLIRIGLKTAEISAALREPIHVGEKVLDPNAIVTDLLYGVYLHGDFDRWQRRASSLPLIDEYSLYVYTVRSAELVRSLALAVEKWVASGALPGDALHRSAGLESGGL